MSKKVLFLRTPPYDINPNAYNLQQVGMGRAFCKLGYDFDFITFKKSNHKEWTFYEYEGHTARYIEKPRFRVFRWGINREICTKEFLADYDIIISQEYYQPMTYWLSKVSNNVAMYSGPYWSLFMFPFTSFFYDAFVTKKLNANIKTKFVKSELAKQFLEKKGYDNVVDIGVALDFDKYNDVQPTEETQKIVEFMQTNRCLLYIGRLDANKNFPFLLRLFSNLLKRNPDLKLVIIGKSKQSAIKKLLGKSDDSFAQELLDKQDESVRNAILHVRALDNPQLQFVYPMAKCFLLSSINEIFGMVLLEAMYFGAPVISSKNGGATTLIKSDEYGQMIDDFSVEAWTSAAEKYLNNEEYRESVVERARKLVKEQYNWDSIVERMLREIERDK